MDKAQGVHVMQRRLPVQFWLPMGMLLSVALWFGCEQKGDLSPVSSARETLAFIDTVIVDPPEILPSATGWIEARVVNEQQEPAPSENVRFTVTRGTFGTSGTDTTVITDNYGKARTPYTAPAEVGNVSLHVELVSMQTTQSRTFSVTETGSDPNGLVTVAADDDSLFADNGASQTQIRARVRTAGNNPVGGAEVNFTTTLGVITSPAVTDAQTGTAIAMLTSTEAIGRAMVIAQYNENSDTVFVNFLEPVEAQSIQVNTSNSTMTAGSDTAVVSARVIGEDGETLQSNVLVTFSANSGSFSAQAVTTQDGIATTTYRAPVTSGTVTITASTGGINGSVGISIQPGALASLTVNAMEDTLFADNSSETTVRVLARDTYGNPALPGTIVAFSSSGGTISESASTDASGYAASTFRAGLNAGNATVTALNGSINGSASIYLRATAAEHLSLTVNPRQLVADGSSTSTLRAQVLDSENRPVSNGTVVTFTSELGQLGGPAVVTERGRERISSKNGSAVVQDNWSRVSSSSSDRVLRGPDRHNSVFSVFSAVTQNGYAVATLTSSTTAGDDDISATTGGLSAQETVTYTAGSPATVEVTPGVTEMPADGVSSTQIVCRVYDAYGNPLRGGIPISITSTLGTLLPTSGFTNASGMFTTNLTSSVQVGHCAIVATAEQASGYGEVEFLAAEVAGVSLSSESSSLLADGTSSVLLTCTVRDEFNQPINGRTVVWSVNAGIGTLEAISSITNNSGIATARFYSGPSTTNASQQVSAEVDGEVGTYTLTMRGVTVLVSLADDMLPADGESTTDVRATIRETSSGIAVAGVPVRFSATAGSVEQFAETNESGIATATYMSDDEPGDVEIGASYGDELRAETGITLTNTEAENLVMSVGNYELLANGIASTAVQATIFDEGGHPVPGTAVTFTAVSNGTFTPETALADENGVAHSVFTAAASYSDMNAPIEAAIERSASQDTLRLLGVELNAGSSIQLLPANGSATATLTINLRETTSTIAIPNATILCGTSLGSVPATVTTNDAGVATVTYTAGTEVGVANIIVRYGNQLRDTVAINLFSPSPSALELSSVASSILADGMSTSALICRLIDQSGSPIPNVPVVWSTVGTGSLLSGTTYTDSEGLAANTFRSAGNVSDGQTIIRVNTQSASDSVTINTRGVTIQASAQYSAMPANGASSNSIQVHVRETTSLVAIPNMAVTFGSSLGIIPASAVTNASGVATASLTAASSSGIAEVICNIGSQLSDTVEVNMYAPTPQSVSVVPQHTSVRADGISSVSVSAIVTDAMGVALSGAPVTWTASGFSYTPVTTMTNAQGMATLNFLPSARTANLASTLMATSETAQGFVEITLRGVTVTANAVPNLVIADGISTSEIQVHVYETASEIAISGAEVSFGTNFGTIPNSATTNESGVASVSLQASTQTGTALISASYGETLTSQATVTFAASTPTTISLTANPTILFADNSSSSTLVANVTDQNGNPVPNGTQVRFSIPPQSGTLENLRTTTGGVANNTLVSSSTPDTFFVAAWPESNPSVRDSVQIIYRVGDPSNVILSATVDSLAADGISTDSVTARVTDAVGHLLPNVEVQFSTTIGNITASRTTNAQGLATVPFSSSQTGTAIITASAGSATGHYTVYLLPGDPNSIQLSFSPNSVGVRGSGRNETLLITATVRDANNNPVLDGTDVFFNINNSPGGGDFLSSTGAIPTINGTATVAYNSGTVSGTARVRAVCEGISGVSTEILIYAGPPYIENILDGCLSSHMAIGASPCNMFGMDRVGESVEVVCLVGDRYNNPVTPGTAVYFTTSGGVITTGTGYTDSSGFARVTLYSGNPLPTVSRWLNTLTDPNLGTSILCSDVPDRDGVAKLLVKTAGVDATGDSVWVWSTTNVIFDYSQPILNIREVTVNGDPNERTLFIGENALIRFALHDFNYWPMVAGTVVSFSASSGNVYPTEIEIGCPGDTSYTISFFNNLTITDDDVATPVLISVDAAYGSAYAFTETFTLRAAFNSLAMPEGRDEEIIQ
ncbi:MAG: Ig-like domain-containing protein [Calditrichaeota bacterium]|nr:Ig-like domain-containing protein [Calditrichota bacterium]MCB9391036.1 Ig-like domain-containing protein [Calditrichota bacterium]